MGLHFKVRGSHFKSGEMKLQCSASIAPLYYKSIEEAVFRSDEVPPVLESKAPTVHGKNPGKLANSKMHVI